MFSTKRYVTFNKTTRCFQQNDTSLSTKQHVTFNKTTRCFQQNDTSLSTKQHVTFNKTIRHFQQRLFAAQCTPLDGAPQTLSYKTQKKQTISSPFSRIRTHIRTHNRSFIIFAVTSVTHFRSKRLSSIDYLFILKFISSFSRPIWDYPLQNESPTLPRFCLGVTLVTAKKLNCCWKACAPARTHVRTRKLERMHATSTAFELYLSDLSPFALCAPSFLRRLWVGKVFCIANCPNLQIRTRNFKTYKTFFITFLRFFPSLRLYLPIYL